ncbi:hypothetical protein SPRG_01924 [Saprolegnia parasitica CBS 223.65]|uniref:GPI transamidase component GAA1 n=1 Tax=Saprolegnia parasitica (strain CBS 223.65) TaxID=695850 RepID=A0A067D275_SAPPC|nr:hypothetical protein SPRG_01924 [Saprolegnia parasitica CBS 223.65]KDO33112.1 hypothetical protein SPRG_01924 [Saprolegnia parasitica CBS 223.65]|eukprot:XP_012195879.1 hypothetical protein SPRG_01924 [Saprolegnia parasitica CBS 223.65]
MTATEVTTVGPPKRRLLEHLYRHGRVQAKALSVSWIGLLLGVTWLLLHPIATVTTGELKCRQTYFSENALLVDTVTSTIDDTQAAWAKAYHREYIKLDAAGDNGCAHDNSCAHVMTWIEAQLRAMPGVEFDRQTYAEQLYDHDEYVNRTNLFAILRASPLADGKESIVLVAQYPNIPSTSKNGYSALSVGLAMLRHLGSVKWLAKDIILLLTDDGPDDGRHGHSPAVEAWLDAYHNDPFATSNAALDMHAGVIRAAINLETSGDAHRHNTVAVLGAGVNGQLPNLDLINSAVEALESERIPVAMDRCADARLDCDGDALSSTLRAVRRFVVRQLGASSALSSYFDGLYHLLRFIQTLAMGPSGPHANFIRHNIDAITLSAVQASGATTPLSLLGWLRSIETTVRAMSNVEEKLHQSFYYYLLVSPRLFVSIGEYYYVLVLVLLPLFAHVLYLVAHTAGLRTALALALFLVAEALGAMVFLVATHLECLDGVLVLDQATTTMSRTYGWTLLAVASGVELLLVVGVLPLLQRHALTQGNPDEADWLVKIDDQRRAFKATLPVDPDADADEPPLDDLAHDVHGWKALKVLACIVAILVHCVVGIINYAFAIAVVVPMTALLASAVPAATPQSVVGRGLRATLVLLSSPLLLALVLQSFQPQLLDTIAYFVHGYVHYGSIALPYACVVYLPLHALALCIVAMPPNPIKSKID